jgi:hypothetical protein
MSPKQLKQDRHTLQLIIDAARSGHAVVILPSEVDALARIDAFIGGPSARDIDAIVDGHKIGQHDAEQTVRALFGKVES